MFKAPKVLEIIKVNKKKKNDIYFFKLNILYLYNFKKLFKFNI